MKCLRACLSTSTTYNINGNKYYKVKTLAEGGYSIVVQVKDRSGLKYAMKCVRLQLEEQETAIAAEIDAYKSLNSNYVIRLLGYTYQQATNKTDKMAYLLFPFMKNGSVQDVITRKYFEHPIIPERDIITWTLDLCRGLEAFHHQTTPLSHRDIKPGNMMITDKNRIVITDLGSVAAARVTVTSRKEALALQELAAVQCTSPYRAPELFEVSSEGNLTEATDIWSVGCTMFAMAFGESPFDGSATAAVSGRYKIPPNHLYSDELMEIIRRCLQVEPESRPTITQLINILEQLN